MEEFEKLVSESGNRGNDKQQFRSLGTFLERMDAGRDKGCWIRM